MTIKVCCVCNKVEHDGSWQYINYIDEGAVASHGYCPQCFHETLVEIENFLAAGREGSARQSNHQGCVECA